MTSTASTFVPADRANGDANTPTNGTGTPTEQFEPSVNRTTVDLTTVNGDSATLGDTVSLPVRERYRQVAVFVTVTGTAMADGGNATVSVPNETLTLDTGFGVEPGSSTTFLLDMAVVEADSETSVLTAAGEPVERNLTTPTTGGSGADTTGTASTDTADRDSGGDSGSTGNTSSTGTAAPTATAANATASGTTATETTPTSGTRTGSE